VPISFSKWTFLFLAEIAANREGAQVLKEVTPPRPALGAERE
jgi:hypothetical protein